MHDFKRLQVWQKSRELAVAIDELARAFPRGDRGVVAGQLRRSALSIPSNIAEGCGKSSRKECVRFLQIAMGSAKETENHLLIAADLRYITVGTRDTKIGEVTSIQRMLAGLMRNLRESGPHLGG
jgi:four helix bundle protein